VSVIQRGSRGRSPAQRRATPAPPLFLCSLVSAIDRAAPTDSATTIDAAASPHSHSPPLLHSRVRYPPFVATRAPRKYTLEDLDALDQDDDRVELIDGDLIREATSFEHGDAQSSMIVEIRGRFQGAGPPGGGGWWIVSEVGVIYADTQVFRHDLCGWRKSRVPERPVGKRVRIRPDWVCEILSTNRNKDVRDKRRVLHECGVPHYWLLDLEAPLLTALRHHADGYLMVATHAPGERARLEPFDSVELEVTKLFGDLE